MSIRQGQVPEDREKKKAVEKELKDQTKLGSKEACSIFLYHPETSTWEEKKGKIQIAKQPFAEGGIRAAFHATIHLDKKNINCVVKIAKKPQDDTIYFNDVAMQMYAKMWAQKFNERNPPKKITFVDAFVVKLTARKETPVYGGESLIQGTYIKHSDNNGYVNNSSLRNTPHAFSHFSYEASSRQLIIVDIQGVGDYYTDPQIHSIGSQGFGLGNLGEAGIQKFLSSHKCNSICQYLGLPPIGIQVQAPTVPYPQPPMQQNPLQTSGPYPGYSQPAMMAYPYPQFQPYPVQYYSPASPVQYSSPSYHSYSVSPLEFQPPPQVSPQQYVPPSLAPDSPKKKKDKKEK